MPPAEGVRAADGDAGVHERGTWVTWGAVTTGAEALVMMACGDAGVAGTGVRERSAAAGGAGAALTTLQRALVGAAAFTATTLPALEDPEAAAAATAERPMRGGGGIAAADRESRTATGL
mmetsp:Transcript_40667/g.126822  ORF Transcript_40667/g.126822 Transcript_40667/m.126822 type:complete len:120 (-) Transcript_40667:494-853(-)